MRFLSPMAARLVDRLPEGAEWLYEVKFDGYRALLLKDGQRVVVRSRNDRDLTATYPTLVAAASSVRAASAIVDGEIVAVDAAGHPSFQALQHRSAHPQHAIAFYAFDLLHLDGRSLLGEPLESRRELLAAAVEPSRLLLSLDLPGSAAEVIAAVRALGLEGIVAKRRTSRYTPGARNGEWLKLKLEQQQEFVIGGFRPGPHGVDALLVGVAVDGQLHFAGKVRAGFTPRVRQEVADALAPLARTSCPFADLPNSQSSHWGGGVTAAQMGEMRWVRPLLLAQVRFVEWTADGHLRHAAFLGLRHDKPPRSVRREGGRRGPA